jgi:hypothetical protein
VIRRLLLGVGLVAVLCGVALTLRPGLVQFELATLLTLGVWAVALLGVGLAAFERFERDDEQTGALPKAGARPDYAVPGDDLAAAVETVGASERDALERERIHDRLRTAAVDALDRFGDCPPTEAEDRLDDGTWTDDPEAAAFFGSETNDAAHEGIDPDFDRDAERATAAIARLHEHHETRTGRQEDGR